MSIGGIREELHEIAQINRDEIPYIEAAAADYDDMRESARSAQQSVYATGESNRAAANEVTSAAGLASEAVHILEEARVKLGSLVLALTDAQGHAGTLSDNISQAASAVQASGQHAEAMHSNLSTAHDLAYRATEGYIRVMGTDQREPVPTAMAHTTEMADASEGSRHLQRVADRADRAVARLAGTPDELLGLHKQRAVEAEHIAAEIERLSIRLSALIMGLSTLNNSHRDYEAKIKDTYDTLKDLGANVLKGAVKELAAKAEAVATTAEKVGDQIAHG